MLYLLAIVGLVSLTVLFWRAFGPHGAGPHGARPHRGGPSRTVVRGPDDDPDFLRTLGPGSAPPGD